MIFLANNSFNRLPLSSERVDDGHVGGIDPQMASVFKPACPWNEPATAVYLDPEFTVTLTLMSHRHLEKGLLLLIFAYR